MTVSGKMKTAAKNVKATTNKVVRKAAKALKPVTDALHMTEPKRRKPATAKKSTASKRMPTKQAR